MSILVLSFEEFLAGKQIPVVSKFLLTRRRADDERSGVNNISRELTTHAFKKIWCSHFTIDIPTGGIGAAVA